MQSLFCLVNLLLSPSWSVSLINSCCSSGGLNNSMETLFHMICRLLSCLYVLPSPFLLYRGAMVLSIHGELIFSYRTAIQPCSELVRLIVAARALHHLQVWWVSSLIYHLGPSENIKSSLWNLTRPIFLF